MTEIKMMIDGEEYTKEQFRKDTIRMFDACRYDGDNMGEMNCKNVFCNNCPLNGCCGTGMHKIFEKIRIIYNWSQENPVITNKDMLKKTFGDDVFSHNVLLREWLDKEYKEPKGEEKNG